MLQVTRRWALGNLQATAATRAENVEPGASTPRIFELPAQASEPVVRETLAKARGKQTAMDFCVPLLHVILADTADCFRFCCA